MVVLAATSSYGTPPLPTSSVKWGWWLRWCWCGTSLAAEVIVVDGGVRAQTTSSTKPVLD
ncbi:hypothetical protein Hdeb2414_s0010g00341341 [Helianthus debilis subsp. tardiflorus]